MDDAKQLWSWWQSLLAAFGPVFTRPGWVRFVQWVTGMVMGWEEHTITQILVSLGLESRWRAMEHFAEYGAWDRPAVERRTISLVEQECPARWGRYHPVAVGDTKLHRTSKTVWGTCTLLRLMQFRLDAGWGEGSYWLKPEWNRRKVHPSILDLRRLFWRYRPRLSKLLMRLEEIDKIPRAAIPARQRADRAA